MSLVVGRVVVVEVHAADVLTLPEPGERSLGCSEIDGRLALGSCAVADSGRAQFTGLVDGRGGADLQDQLAGVEVVDARLRAGPDRRGRFDRPVGTCRNSLKLQQAGVDVAVMKGRDLPCGALRVN